jgi:hypothetical protein
MAVITFGRLRGPEGTPFVMAVTNWPAVPAITHESGQFAERERALVLATPAATASIARRKRARSATKGAKRDG